MGALALVAWVLVTLLATRPGFKLLFDLSPQAQFSLTAETLELIEELLFCSCCIVDSRQSSISVPAPCSIARLAW